MRHEINLLLFHGRKIALLMLSAVLVKWFICAFGKKLVHPTVLSPSDKLQPWPLHNVAAFTSVGLGLRCGCFIAINIAAVGRLSCWRQAQMMKKIAGIIGTSGDAPAMLVPAYSASLSAVSNDKICHTKAFTASVPFRTLNGDLVTSL